MAAFPKESATNSIACSLLLIAALRLSGTEAVAAPQIASLPQTISGGEYRIAGTVVSKTDGHPLTRARITVRDAKDPQKFLSIVTSDDGTFEFTGLPGGKYSLQGAKRGFISAAYEQHDQFSTAIVTGASLDTETLTLGLAPDAVISGRVLDEVGEPIRHATVTLYYDDHSRGIDQIHQSRGAQTDDQGAYELTPLQPGTYFLSATAKPWYVVHPTSEPEGQRKSSPPLSVDRSLDVAYPVTYYPDTTDAESATPIPIRGGEHVQLDIHFSPVPALRLLFHVPDDGKNGVTFPQLQQSAFDSSTFVQSDGGRMVSPGLFEITGIPAGRYNLRFLGAGQGTQMDGVDLTRDGEEIDTSKSEALSTVKVSVRIPGEATVLPRLFVGLRSGPRAAPAFQVVNAKGEIEFQQVAPGRYDVVVGAPGKPYSISHMAAEGADASGHTLTVAAGSAPLVSLTLVGGSVEVQGVAKRAGKAFAGAMVVLVPKNPESDRDLFRRDQSDLDGTFSLRGVIPGFYTLIAIENGWDLDWWQRGVIAAYRKHGRAIQVGTQGARLMNVTEPVEVQSK
jgi:hypothetical protein